MTASMKIDRLTSPLCDAETGTGRSMGSLRVRLVLAFLLVGVPPMLAAAYLAASLISGAFLKNVEEWLTDTSRFFVLELSDAESDSARLAKVLSTRVPELGLLGKGATANPEIDLVFSQGYDLLAIYDAKQTIRYASRPFVPFTPLPTGTKQALFSLEADGRRYLMTGAVEPFQSNGETLYLLVGTWIEETYLGGIRLMTELDLHLYYKQPSGFSTIGVAGQTPTRLSEAIVARLTAEDRPVYIDDDIATYGSVYAGLHDASGALVGVIACGLEARDGFLPKIGGWGFYAGMLAFGTVLSVLAGTWVSGLLVRPLRALSAAVRSVTAGDYHQRVPEVGGAELSELARSFNTMSEQLNRMHDLEVELRRRDRLAVLGEAATVIAHEVRNPLGIIQTSAELVRQASELRPADEKLLGYVIDEVRRIERLVRDFLDFAHPKAPLREPVALRPLVDRVAAFGELELATRGIEFCVEDHAPGAIVAGDADQLYQACLNLILNAMDAMPHGGCIRCRIETAGSGYALVIADTGTGISPDIVSRIFNPFFTTKSKGTGLGLAKVQTVAQAHGGNVDYADAPGGGASFRIVLKRYAARDRS
jgi:signal transduction histidine kinase